MHYIATFSSNDNNRNNCKLNGKNSQTLECYGSAVLLIQGKRTAVSVGLITSVAENRVTCSSLSVGTFLMPLLSACIQLLYRNMDLCFV